MNTLKVVTRTFDTLTFENLIDGIATIEEEKRSVEKILVPAKDIPILSEHFIASRLHGIRMEMLPEISNMIIVVAKGEPLFTCNLHYYEITKYVPPKPELLECPIRNRLESLDNIGHYNIRSIALNVKQYSLVRQWTGGIWEPEECSNDPMVRKKGSLAVPRSEGLVSRVSIFVHKDVPEGELWFYNGENKDLDVDQLPEPLIISKI